MSPKIHDLCILNAFLLLICKNCIFEHISTSAKSALSSSTFPPKPNLSEARNMSFIYQKLLAPGGRLCSVGDEVWKCYDLQKCFEIHNLDLNRKYVYQQQWLQKNLSAEVCCSKWNDHDDAMNFLSNEKFNRTFYKIDECAFPSEEILKQLVKKADKKILQTEKSPVKYATNFTAKKINVPDHTKRELILQSVPNEEYQYPETPSIATYSTVENWLPPPLPFPLGHQYPIQQPIYGTVIGATTQKTHSTSHSIAAVPTPISSTTTKLSYYPLYPSFSSLPSYPMYTTQKPGTTRKPTSSEENSANSHNGLPLKCGMRNALSKDQERIVGGINASPHEFPWIVVLFQSGKQFCGGSLITKIHVLTAAHCVARMTAWDVAALTANLGDYNIRSNFEVKHVTRRIKRLVRHKGFDFSHLHNDIAILTLSEPVEFSYEIQPVCLPTSPMEQTRSYSGQVATVAGWGSLRESGPQPAILQKVQIPVWSNNDCARKYGSAAPGGITGSMLCAGQISKDSCSGDSGGPMVVKEGSRYVQIGIVSWGIGCGKGQYPGVYTRVTSLLPWILKNIK